MPLVSEDKLIGWLCFLGYQFEQGDGCHLPLDVHAGLVERGWLAVPEAAEWDGKRPQAFTDAGFAAYDLNAPDWSIDTIPQETEA